MPDKVICPQCGEKIVPKIYRAGKILFAIECPKCGYDMKREVMELLEGER